MPPASQVVGRESELESIHDFLDGRPCRALPRCSSSGSPGSGRRRSGAKGVAAAGDRGLVGSRSCRPVEAEIALPFAALGDLLEHVPGDVLARLPEPQREALEIALLRAETKPGPLHGRAVAVGVLGAIRALAEHSPVFVAIDDVQWLDSPSADALAFAARRLRDEPVGFLLARRADARDDAPLPLESALDSTRVTRLPVGPLDLQSLDRLLRSQLDRQFLRPALVELQRVSGGNPFFALELGRALLARDVSPAPGEPLPLPATLNEVVRERLEGLPAEAAEAALVVSALSTSDGRARGHGSRRGARGRRCRAGERGRCRRGRRRPDPVLASAPRLGRLCERVAVAEARVARAPGGGRGRSR